LRLSGDPAKAMLSDDASQAQIDAFNQKYGLNEPICVQYTLYLRNILQGDFGNSLGERRPVTELVHARVGSTLLLGVTGIAIALIFGLPAGILAAINHNRVWDRLLTAGTFFGQSLPNFFLGILLILLFSLQLRWLPSSGTGTWQHLVLPAFTLSTGLLSSMARMTRSSLLETMRQDYVRTAHAKGFSNGQVILRHCFRNAAIPVLTLFGLSIGVLIGGAAITETIFAWPGIGRFAVRAIAVRDYPLIQYIVLLVAGTVVIANFVVDLLYGAIDPRIRSERAAS
jgi:peptide/nickel transport system permease protein